MDQDVTQSGRSCPRSDPRTSDAQPVGGLVDTVLHC
jgi:hypothetical protein